MNKCKFNEGSNFDRQGQWVIGKYMHDCFVTGFVKESRVKYGGTVQHTIVSDSLTVITYNGEIRAVGTTFLLEENNLEYCESIRTIEEMML